MVFLFSLKLIKVHPTHLPSDFDTVTHRNTMSSISKTFFLTPDLLKYQPWMISLNMANHLNQENFTTFTTVQLVKRSCLPRLIITFFFLTDFTTTQKTFYLFTLSAC